VTEEPSPRVRATSDVIAEIERTKTRLADLRSKRDEMMRLMRTKDGLSDREIARRIGMSASYVRLALGKRLR
jgi:ribosome-binding protein aMBF1 (putative translation factor)